MKMKRERLNLKIRRSIQYVRAIQENIAFAKRSDFERACILARELVISVEARTLAVHRVVTNRGQRSKGLSDHSLSTYDHDQSMVDELLVAVLNPKQYRSCPLDKVYMTKKSGKLRPVSIPSYFDRCIQSLYALAIEPMVEEEMDKSSYGF